MNSKFIFKAIFLLGLFLDSAMADTFFVEKLKTQGLDESSRETIYELILNAISSEGHESIAKPSKSTPILVPKILKLGESYILKIDKVSEGRVQFSSKMKATSLDDMDTVAVRVVRSVINESNPKEGATVADVTQDEETQGTRRFKAIRQWRFAFGPAWSHGLNVKGGGTQWGLGYSWGLDPDFDLRLHYSFYVPRSDEDDNARFMNLSLGLDYYLTDKKHSPFVGFDIGYASAAASDRNSTNFFNLSDDTASGWTVGISAGVKFFRTSTVNLGIVANHYFMFDKTDKSDKTPQLSTLNLVVYY